MATKIEAIIREERLHDVKEALRELGIVGLNVFEVRGHGRQGGLELAGRTGSYIVDMLTKIQLNVVLSDHNVEKTIDTICKAARTGETGDGVIFVYPIQEVIRIRTGERGQDALTYEGDIDDRKTKNAPVPKQVATSTMSTAMSNGKTSAVTTGKKR
jgi:nitrogen regulatory protein P-II 1